MGRRDPVPCPVCGKPCQCDRWYDEIWGASHLVETVEECKPCGYVWHYSYGATSLEIGKRSFGYYHDAPPKVKDRAHQRFDKYLAKARRRYRKTHWRKVA